MFEHSINSILVFLDINRVRFSSSVSAVKLFVIIMKKVTSIVWKFFERIEEKGRCVAVLCKLCESEYKFFGNTTNLRAHLKNKHPIQWEFSEVAALDDSQIEHVEVNSTPSSTTKRKKAEKVKPNAKDKTIGYSVSIDSNGEAITTGTIPRIAIQRVESDSENDEDTINLVRQMHGEQHSSEEWLEEDPYQITHIETYEPQPKKRKMKYRKIKREIPSPTDLPGYYVTPKATEISFEDTRSRTKDEYSVFGEYIANKLRKLKTPRTRGNIQQLITTLLWQAEYGMYDNADAVKRVLMHSIEEPVMVATDVDNPTSDQVTEVIIEQVEEVNQSQDSVNN